MVKQTYCLLNVSNTSRSGMGGAVLDGCANASSQLIMRYKMKYKLDSLSDLKITKDGVLIKCDKPSDLTSYDAGMNLRPNQDGHNSSLDVVNREYEK